MSAVSTPQDEFDFWEFVNCGICHLEFVKDTGTLSSAPFWLTECGHVVCNSHLNPDQSCAECGKPGIHLTPLAREMESPLCNWFESAPLAFDAAGFALRFQLNTMVSLVRYFKKKYIQYRPLYEHLKEEHAETQRLRRQVDELQKENHELKSRLQASGVDWVNGINKRQRTDESGRYKAQRSSSPRSAASVSTPVGPDRLTLPANHHQPQFNARQHLRSSASAVPRQNISKYAYAPPASAQARTMVAPTLTHVQSGSSRHAQAREPELQDEHSNMPPPPVPNRTTDYVRTHSSNAGSSHPVPQRSTSVVQPPTPSSRGLQRFTPQTSRTATTGAGSTNGIMPGPHFDPQRRFLPSSAQRIPSAAAGSSFGSGSLASGGMVSQRSPSLTSSGFGGQRTPFVPGTAGGRP